MKKGKSISIIVPDGDPLNPIRVGMSSWTGYAFRLKRDYLQNAKNISELKQCGVYFLYGREQNTSGISESKQKIYIGQGVVRQNGEGVFARINEHNTPKESYWTDAIAFVDTKNEWGKTEISYLENRFTNAVLEAKKHACSFEIVNGNNPNPGNVTEAKQWELNDYIEGAEIVLSVLGYNFFIEEKSEDANELSLNEEIFNSKSNLPSSDEKAPKNEKANNESNVEFPFKIGQVMAYAFRWAFLHGRLNNDILFLESQDASKLFKTRGNRVIVANEKRPQKQNGIRRFAKDPVVVNNKTYWITTQTYKEGLEALLAYLEKRGLSRNIVIRLCETKGEISDLECEPIHQTSIVCISFLDYLKQTMCKNSASNYRSSFRDLEKILLERKIISTPLTIDTSFNIINAVRNFLNTDSDFISYNKKRNYSRSAAWGKFEEYINQMNPSKQE